MRPLRWKSRYQTGDGEADRRNRAFVDCLNSLINAAGQREHCREMEDFIYREKTPGFAGGPQEFDNSGIR